MITRVYFVAAMQDNPNGGVTRSFRIVQHKSILRPNMIDMIDKALQDMSKTTGLPFSKWCVCSFSKVA